MQDLIRVLICAAACLAGVSTAAHADVFGIDPRTTFLRTNNDPGALGAFAIDLSALSFAVDAGDTLLLEGLGDFRPGTSAGHFDASKSLLGVFSSSTTLLGASNLNRVVGALEAGADVVSSATFFGAVPTDIPQDFLIYSSAVASVLVQVPVGAQFLFVAPNDSFYGDNSDPDGDFGLRITSAIPEPGTYALLLAGLGLLGFAARLGERQRDRRSS